MAGQTTTSSAKAPLRGPLPPMPKLLATGHAPAANAPVGPPTPQPTVTLSLPEYECLQQTLQYAARTTERQEAEILCLHNTIERHVDSTARAARASEQQTDALQNQIRQLHNDTLDLKRQLRDMECVRREEKKEQEEARKAIEQRLQQLMQQQPNPAQLLPLQQQPNPAQLLPWPAQASSSWQARQPKAKAKAKAKAEAEAEAEADVSWHRQRGRRGGWKRLGRACAFFHVCARISCAPRISCARFLRALRLRASFAHFLCAPYMTVVRAFLCTRLTSCHLA